MSTNRFVDTGQCLQYTKEMNELEILYLKKTIKLIEEDIQKIDKRVNKWLHVDTSSKAKITEWLDLHNSGYTGEEDIKNKVELEMLLVTFKNKVWRLEQKY